MIPALSRSNGCYSINLFLVYVIFCIGCTASIDAQVTAQNLIEGPMMGALNEDQTSVNVLLRNGTGSSSFTVKLKQQNNSSFLESESYDQFCIQSDTCLYSFRFNNLISGMAYKAIVYKNNVAIDSMKTYVRLNNSAVNNFSFLAGSCAHLSDMDREIIFDNMSAENNISFMLWLGDQIYLPSSNLTERLFYQTYLRYKTQSPKRKNFMKHKFHIAIWDDHEYSYNNGTADNPMKELAAEGFKSFWPNSGYDHPESEGISSTFFYKDVDFFLTDVRYHKSRNVHLGKEQLEELKNKLLQSQATFKFIALGSVVVWEREDSSLETTFYQTGERDELFEFIYENEISGVIFLTGDIHKGYIAKYSPDCNGTYPIHELVSSPLTSGSGENNINDAQFITKYNGQMYARIDIHGQEGNRTCTLTTKNNQGETFFTMNINEQELMPASIEETDTTADQMAAFDFNQNTLDTSSYSHHANSVGMSYASDRFQNANTALKATAYPQYLNIPNTVLNQTQESSVSFWIYPNTLGCGLFSGASSTDGNEFLIYFTANQYLQIRIKNQPVLSQDTFDLNTWHHVVVSRNGYTGEVKMYVNGKLQIRKILPAGHLEIVPNGLIFGNDQDGGGGGNLDPNQQFKGRVDDIRFYQKLLCLDNVLELYNEKREHITETFSQVVCSAGNHTFEASGASQGNYRWYRDKDDAHPIANAQQSTYSTYLYGTSTLWVAANNGFKDSERKAVTITVAPSIYTDDEGYTYPRDLEAWYPWDGSFADLTNQFGAASTTGSINFTTDRFGNSQSALQIGQYPSYVSMDHTLLNHADALSLSFWIKTTTNEVGVISATSSFVDNEMLIFLRENGTLSATINDSGKGFYHPVVNDNQWHHVVFTSLASEGIGNLYVDGQLTMTNASQLKFGTLEVPINAFIIGNDQDSLGGGLLDENQQFIGSFDDFRMYRRVLNADEVLALYTNQSLYQEPFVLTPTPLSVCEEEDFTLELSPTQENVSYKLYDQNNTELQTATYQGNIAQFELMAESSNQYIIKASNEYGCENEFNTPYIINVNESPNAILIQNGNQICSVEEASNYIWYFNGEVINSNQQCIPVQGNGNYTLHIENLWGCTDENTEAFSFLHTEEEDFECIYNPSMSYYDCWFAKTPKLMKIYNAEGRLVHVQNPENQLNINHLPTATYWLQTDFEDGSSQTQSLLVQ